MVDYSVLGTPGGLVEVVPYNPLWPQIYAHTAAHILQACGDVISAIEHIGSTSVLGLPAKPIIDIMPGIITFENGLSVVAPLAELGYFYFGENGIPGRHYFHLQFEGRVVVHVHIFAVGSEDWQRHLLFRDYLRAHAWAAEAYTALKRELAGRFHADRGAYTDGKGEFINAIVARARAEAVLR